MTSSRATGRGAKLRAALDVVASAAMLVAAALIVGSYFRGPKAARPTFELPEEPVSLDGASLKGSREARVGLLEFADFECPFCGVFAREVLPSIDREYVAAGRAFLAFRHLPLASHAFARSAAETAVCAGQQGAFWDLHARLFERPNAVRDADLVALAAETVAEPASLRACVLERRTASEVDRDLLEARRYAISSTPFFLVGRLEEDRRFRVSGFIAGAAGVEEFRNVLESELQQAQRTAPR